MTFWGVEVKPGESFTVDCEELGGKLILTQATLGDCSSRRKCILQCNVGDKSPVFLCTLLPEKSESCSLNLEFDEEDDVKFSVIGPTSIHLAGFVQEVPQDSDDEGYGYDAYGEDIAGTESEESDYNSEESSDYDFIDDDDMTMYPPSTVPNSGVVIEELEDDEKASGEIGASKQSKKKKNQLAGTKNDQKALVVKKNTGASVLESEDEDGFLVSKKSETDSENGDTKTEDTKRKRNEKKTDSKNDEDDRSVKRKIDAVDHSEEPKSDAVADKKKKKKQKGKTDDGDADDDTKKEVPEAKKTPTADTKQSKAKQAKVRTYSNGLVVEQLHMGKPDGKRACKGRKVSVRYIGKLQKNGKQFDSNIGRGPFKFRLGVGQVIKGWDVGVKGMRVGDKRRLTVPPSMGYGKKGAPPQIPPNAWLVFDVELVDAAR